MTNQKKRKTFENENIMKKVTNILQERSAKSFSLAKEIILNEKRECKEINEAFEYYTKHWVDYAHVGLISLACEAVDGIPDDAVPIQAAMLLLTASVDIHDDIIDESKMKYGRPTLFGKFGKDIALLVGDVFLIKALTLLNKSRKLMSVRKNDAIWDIINKQFFELGDAEALETFLKGNVNASPEKCLHILEKKASDFEIHTRIGAIVGGGKQDEIDTLGDYGRTLGILAGVRENFIDIFEPDELQNRMKNECLPLPILYAFKNPRAKEAIMKTLLKPKISNKDAQRIVDIVFKDRNVKTFKNKIQRLTKKALKNISKSQNENAKSQMKLLMIGALEDL